jgi:hypothetical protein
MKTLRWVCLAVGLGSFGCATGKAPGDEGAGGDAGAEARTGVRGVSGGVKASSPNYQLIGTMGEGPGATGTSESPAYRLQGGVVGTTQDE